MGVVLSRLWATKKSFRDHLEGLEAEIKRTEVAQQRSAIIKRNMISSIVLWSSVVYIASFVLYYLLFFPPTWTMRLLYAVPFFVAPAFIFTINRYVNFYLERKYQKYGTKIQDLKSEKRQVLEEVIETESFKNAKELLERFDPESTLLQPSALQANSMMMTPSNPMLLTPARPDRLLANHNTPIPVTPNMELRRRIPHQTDTDTPLRPVAATSPQPRSPVATPPKRSVKPQRKLQKEVTPVPKPRPKVMSSSGTQTASAPKSDRPVPTGVANRTPQVQIVREYLLPGHVKNERAGGPPQPLQILPAQRSSVDKVVEFVIGDGPNNRFALICSQCHSHNGMALPEDFEYTTFRCAYCYTVNSARRNTPITQHNVYKLPNLQVKPPVIVREIESGPAAAIVEDIQDTPPGTPDFTETPDFSEEEEEEEGNDSVHKTPEKDLMELLDETVETVDAGC